MKQCNVSLTYRKNTALWCGCSLPAAEWLHLFTVGTEQLVAHTAIESIPWVRGGDVTLPKIFPDFFLSLHMEYGKYTEFTVSLFFFFLFGHGFLRRGLHWPAWNSHEASPISEAGLLKFWGQYPTDCKIVALNMTADRRFGGAVWRDMHYPNALVEI